jgi:hypothetical protein
VEGGRREEGGGRMDEGGWRRERGGRKEGDGGLLGVSKEIRIGEHRAHCATDTHPSTVS